MKFVGCLLLILGFQTSAFAIQAGDLISSTEVLTLSTLDVEQRREDSGISYEPEVDPDIALIHYYRIKYYTPGVDGGLTTASGLFIVPRSRKPMPLLSYQHGTTTNRSDAPSMNPCWGESLFATLFFVTRGYAVVLPDGLGLGSSEAPYHPYLHSITEASSAADLLKAVQKIAVKESIKLSGQLFLSGYSQGGHWTMALQQSLETNPLPQLTISASAAMAAPLDLSGSCLTNAFESPGRYTTSYSAYILFATQMIYGNIVKSWKDAIRPPYAVRFPQIFLEGKSLSSIARELPDIPLQMFTATYVDSLRGDANHPLRMALEKNDLYDWAPRAPVLLVQSRCDAEVPFYNSMLAAEKMRKQGGKITFITLKGKYSHSGGFVPSYIRAVKFFEPFREKIRRFAL